MLQSTLVLARRGSGAVEPDPFVGALIVAGDGSLIGHGHHELLGGAHAEPAALAEAGIRARDGTLYCNLEPCGYTAPEKRQPACTDAIIVAGVRRVVLGQIDPHPRVRGRGIERLRDAGIEVDLAPDPRPFWEANPVFTTYMSLGRPLLHVLTGGPSTSTAAGPWHDASVSADSLAATPAETYSVRTYAPRPDVLRLPRGWQVDYIDGQPTEAWFRALEATT